MLAVTEARVRSTVLNLGLNLSLFVISLATFFLPAMMVPD